MHQKNSPLLLFLFTLIFNSPFLIAAQSSPECPYPCLPPPTTGFSYPPPPPFSAAGYPPPPPDGGGLYSYPPPSGLLPFNPSPPSFIYPAPPPPDPITPWFPFYRRLPSSASRRSAGFMLFVGSAVCTLLLV